MLQGECSGTDYKARGKPRALLFVAMLIAWLSAEGAALAAWKTTITPGSSLTAIQMQGELDSGRFLQAFCEGDYRSLALLNYDGQNDQPSGDEPPVTLTIKADTGSLFSSEGQFFRHSQGWIGVKYSNVSEMAAIIASIGNAEATVDVAIVNSITGESVPTPGAADGAREAASLFLDACFGGAPEQTAPALQPATGPTKAWTVAETSPGSGAEGRYDLSAWSIEPGGLFGFSCGPDGVTLAYLTNEYEQLPVNETSGPFEIVVFVSPVERIMMGALDTRAPNFWALTSTEDDVYRLIEMMGNDPNSIVVMIRDIATAKLYRKEITLENVGPAARDFAQKCDLAQKIADVAPNPSYTPWSTGSGVGDGDPDSLAVLTAISNPAAGFLRIACGHGGSDWSIGFVSHDWEGLPFTSADGPFTLTVHTDSRSWSYPGGEWATVGEDRAGVMVKGGAAISDLATSFSLGYSSLAVSIEGASGGNWRFELEPDGEEDAGIDLFGTCMGLM